MRIKYSKRNKHIKQKTGRQWKCNNCKLTRVWVISIHWTSFLYKILGTKIFCVIVKLAGFVGKVVVKTLTSWLHVTSNETSKQVICTEWVVDVIDQGETMFREVICTRSTSLLSAKEREEEYDSEKRRHLCLEPLQPSTSRNSGFLKAQCWWPEERVRHSMSSINILLVKSIFIVFRSIKICIQLRNFTLLISWIFVWLYVLLTYIDSE